MLPLLMFGLLINAAGPGEHASFNEVDGLPRQWL